MQERKVVYGRNHFLARSKWDDRRAVHQIDIGH